MKIQSSPHVFEIDKGRKCSITAVDAAFQLTLNPELQANQKMRDGDRLNEDEVRDALDEAGFHGISPLMTLDEIAIAANARPPAYNKNRHYDGGVAILSAPILPEEDVVLLEFNPATGEVLDWYEPIPSDVMPSISQLMAFVPAAGNQREAVYALFEIPLQARYTSDPSAYSSNKVMATSSAGLVKKVFKLFSLKKIKKLVRRGLGKVLTGPVKSIDRRLVRDETLGLFASSGSPIALTPEDQQALEGKTGLLFVHGIISSSSQAFGGLQQDGRFYKTLAEAYSGNLIAYDHWTLSKDIFENASHLAASLPKGMKLDIVCHSRGAGVVRALVELPEIRSRLENKGISIGKVVFVAGACEGSDLATGDALENIFRVFNKMGVLLGARAFPTTVLLEAIKLIVGGLQELPGTDSMDPDGKFIKELHESQCTLAEEYNYFRSNYDPAIRHAAAIDSYAIDRKIFSNKGNDVIVPFTGAGISDNYLAGKVRKTLIMEYGTETESQSDVWHITFFNHPNTRSKLQNLLVSR